MAETKIEWADFTFNPWMGCQKVSPACEHCYAERDFDHRYKKVKWGPNGTRVVTSDANWRKPLGWNKVAAAEQQIDLGVADLIKQQGRTDLAKDEAMLRNTRPRVFCASLADVFESRELTEWADICDGYRVSIRGEIQSQWRSGGHRGDWVVMKTRLDKGGYETIQLRRQPIPRRVTA